MHNFPIKEKEKPKNTFLMFDFSFQNFENRSTRMSGYGHKVQKVMVQPINLVFRFFQKKIRVQVFQS